MDILDAIGNTSMVRLHKVVPPECAEILVKLGSEDRRGRARGVLGAARGPAGAPQVSALSGLTDVDVITLSVARLVGSEQIDPAQGWRLIVVGLLSNLVFKGAMAALLGDRRLRRWILLLLGLQLLAWAAVLRFW